jgi:hypothetical protein
MREPGILGTGDRLDGVAYAYITTDEAAQLRDDLTRRLEEAGVA